MGLRRPTAWISAFFVVVLAVLPTAPAHADTPNWSGLDARFFAEPIPAQGTTIASVPLDPALSISGAGPAYRVLYSTLDQHDQPAVSTGAVFLPPGPAPEGGFPVIAWAHGTVGMGDDCTPSALPRTPRDNEYLSHWLNEGYAVVASDYAGLGTPGLMSYLNSVTTAHGVVDSVVAAHDMGLPLSPKWAIVGQSQGGGAAISSARWATEFSEGTGLDYRGVVATGTPANIDEFIKHAGPDLQLPELGPIANAYAAYIIAALREVRPDLDIDSVLSPAGLDAAQRAETVCVLQLSEQLARLTPAALFSAPLNTIPGIADALYAFMGTPSTGFDRPIILGVGLLDRDVPPQLTLAFYDQLVANNQNVTLRIYPEEDHSGTVLASLPDSTPFLRNVFVGN
ncbi:prolyl oligopeptidase family serine peptidase [Mycobacterium sp. 236(2023)]|uniref:alpha/beta hydrolase family protein n=1 Tax=Mycobacterium sp. 236(2023) TaxID=3038163 RepID=UPI002415643F|nr:prolyl oligopeptidase family serine peptidase [Mycobacterium sp. 236(2023)]MDG4665215.1 prolyl oligopeptidase family serine peptidase [Mycobacterium sp. 236(2023)]